MAVQAVATTKTLSTKPHFTIFTIGNAKSEFNASEKTTEQLTFKMIFDQLSEYNLNSKVASFDTAYNHMERFKNICIRNLAKTAEREKLFIFSEPQTFLLSPRLYFSPQLNVEDIAAIKQLSFREVFKHYPKLSIGFESNRAYGKQLSKQFENFPLENMFMRADSNGENLMIAMLLKGRIDMLVEYPYVFDYKSKKISPELKIQHSSISDIEPFMFAHLACSKSDESHQLIREVNTVLTALYHKKQYKDSHLKWIEKSNHPVFIELFDEFIKNKI